MINTHQYHFNTFDSNHATIELFNGLIVRIICLKLMIETYFVYSDWSIRKIYNDLFERDEVINEKDNH